MERKPKVVPPGEGQKLHIRNEAIYIKLSGEETAGACAVLESWTPPGGGPPMHRHTREDECFYVLEGEYEFRVGEQTMRAPAGTLVFGPRGIPHSFKNIGDKPARMLGLIQPAGLENLFREASEMLRSGKADRSQMAALSARYGIEEIPETLPQRP
jgi:quercetin dioxygenase-like cupin family protein